MSNTPFDTMRQTLAARGTAPVVNLTMHLDNRFFDESVIQAAIDTAEQRVAQVAMYGEMAEPLSPLETFAIIFLMRASGQHAVRPAEAALQE